MLSFISNTLIGIIEQELIKAEPEMQAFIISQLSESVSMLMEYFNGKLSINKEDPLISPPQEEVK